MNQQTTPQTAAQTAQPNADGDYLGYGDYADTLWARIEKSLQKDADGKTELGDDPLVVGIFGEWGAGKSKLLSMVRQRAEQQSLRDIAQRMEGATKGKPMTVTVPVFFQPWKYEHESHLHVPLAVHIADALKQTWKAMPTDMEAVKVWATKSGQFGNDAIEKIGKAKEVFDQLQGYYKGALKFVQSDTAKMVAGVTDIALASTGMPPLISVARTGIIKALGDGDGEFWDDDADLDADEEDIEKPTSGFSKKEKPKAKPKLEDAFIHTNDGLGFYRLHQRLQALTRPKTNQKLLQSLGMRVTEGIEFDLHINFVVLIDDLDRCLPEKAVEALELIKTVFNLESFAFVLALDEEVVERGIGHRYRDYNFEGKKPEMPITGFEYLEKIVHLPFRLPALTEPQGMQFVRWYEESIEKDDDKRWFDAPWQPKPKEDIDGSNKHVDQGKESEKDMRHALRSQPQGGFGYDLLPLALQGFDAYVPRKLIRMVELMHQTAAVLDKRGRPLGRHPQAGAATGDGAPLDTRVVLALAMVQLFQPELYRIMRRRVNAFPFLLATFADRGKGVRDFPSFEMSDIDLWDWVAKPATSATSAKRSRTAQAVEDAVKRIGEVYQADPTQRNYAQHTRLPVVTQLVEHRSAQRHVFDVLKLMQALAISMEDTASKAGQFDSLATDFKTSPAANLTFKDYRTLLAQSVLPVPSMTGVYADIQTGKPNKVRLTDSRPLHTVRDVDKLLSDLLNRGTELQANLAADFPQGHVLAAQSATALLQKIQSASIRDADATTQQLISGLPYLAPYLSRQDGLQFWTLVQNALQGNDDMGHAIKDQAALAQRERWADLRSTLGADPRFDRETLYGAKTEGDKTMPGLPLYLPKARHVWTNPSLSDQDAQAAEPIPGFILIPGGEFQMGQDKESDNLTRPITIEKPFYIARHLTTVDQYASFVDSGGYAQDGLWDKQGIEWREGRFDSKVEDKDYREYLARRTPALRQRPMDWDEQRSRGSRPVMRLSWFEARAYTRWLQERLSSEGPYKTPFESQAALAGYRVVLPTEAQWERAARAQDLMSSDAQRVWPWLGDGKTAHLKANIDGSKIGRASVVGLFAPNPVGLHDMAGNLWEWQDNLSDEKGDTVQRRLVKDEELKSLEDLDKSDRPALRGGSWGSSAISARCSCRFGFVPDYWFNYLGFRVVLSLANLKSET
jgi:formylglycine-generating enzyme required for sulfatase activity